MAHTIEYLIPLNTSANSIHENNRHCAWYIFKASIQLVK